MDFGKQNAYHRWRIGMGAASQTVYGRGGKAILVDKNETLAAEVSAETERSRW